MQGMGWSCMEELVWGDAQHSWVRPGQLFTRGPGTYKVGLEIVCARMAPACAVTNLLVWLAVVAQFCSWPRLWCSCRFTVLGNPMIKPHL